MINGSWLIGGLLMTIGVPILLYYQSKWRKEKKEKIDKMISEAQRKGKNI